MLRQEKSGNPAFENSAREAFERSNNAKKIFGGKAFSLIR
jgi:hypothetical protein